MPEIPKQKRQEPRTFGDCLRMAEEDGTVYKPTIEEKGKFQKLLEGMGKVDAPPSPGHAWIQLKDMLELLLPRITKGKKPDRYASYVFHLHGGKTLAVVCTSDNTPHRIFVQNTEGSIVDIPVRATITPESSINKNTVRVDNEQIEDISPLKRILDQTSRELMASFHDHMTPTGMKLEEF